MVGKAALQLQKFLTTAIVTLYQVAPVLLTPHCSLSPLACLDVLHIWWAKCAVVIVWLAKFGLSST